MAKSLKELYATSKPKSEWKKRSKDVMNRNSNDQFKLTFTISNELDYTNTQHTSFIEGNFEGMVSHLKNYFNFVFQTHYKPILNSNNVKHTLPLHPLNLGKSKSKQVLSEKCEAKNSLIDRHLLSLLSLTKIPLSAPQIDKLTTKGRKEYEQLLKELNISIE
jgi:hypothetical protein